MGISISPTRRLIALPEFRFKQGYLLRNQKVIDGHLRGLDLAEFALVRALVFPVDRNWPPATHLPSKLSKAVDTVLGNPRALSYFLTARERIDTKLSEWNTFAQLPKPEFIRKVEGSGYVAGAEMRVIKPYGVSFYDFIEFCRLYEKVNVYKVVRDTLIQMRQKKWTGIITPKVCTCLLSGKEMPVMEGTKLKELDIE